MFRSFGVSLALLCGLLGGLPQLGSAADYRTFTAKSGSQIEAKVIGFGAYKRMVKIERRDAQVFELEIVRLSLIDQQYLKTWLETVPDAAQMIAPPIDFSIDVRVDKIEEKRDRSESDPYKFTSTPIFYNLTVTNKTREALRGATLHYFTLMENEVTLLNDPDRTARWTPSVEFTLMLKSQKVLMEELLFNRDVVIRTHDLIEEVVLGAGNYRYGSDEIAGVIGVVKDRGGRILHEFRSTTGEGNQFTYDSLVQEFGEPPETESDVEKGRTRRPAPDL